MIEWSRKPDLLQMYKHHIFWPKCWIHYPYWPYLTSIQFDHFNLSKKCNILLFVFPYCTRHVPICRHLPIIKSNATSVHCSYSVWRIDDPQPFNFIFCFIYFMYREEEVLILVYIFWFNNHIHLSYHRWWDVKSLKSQQK